MRIDEDRPYALTPTELPCKWAIPKWNVSMVAPVGQRKVTVVLFDASGELVNQEGFDADGKPINILVMDKRIEDDCSGTGAGAFLFNHPSLTFPKHGAYLCVVAIDGKEVRRISIIVKEP